MPTKRPANYAQLAKAARAIATEGHIDPKLLQSGAQPATKLDTLREAFARCDYQKALAIAARFPQLGKERDAILEAHGAYTNPRFAQQLGKDTGVLIHTGIEALRTKYAL